MHETPSTGGDTMWASACEVYDRISPSFQSYLETLTSTCAQPVFKKTADAGGYPVMEPRGSLLNIGDTFAPHHPVVRTNPVTGWKGIFAVGPHCTRIDDVYQHESDIIRDYFLRLLTHNHDLQCRFKWKGGDVAIWDNRTVYRAATPDLGSVAGTRAGKQSFVNRRETVSKH